MLKTKRGLNSPNLAVNGGNPVRRKPWADNITTGEEEKAALARVIDSGYLSLFEGSHTPDAPFSFWGGPVVQDLERRWRDQYGAKHAVSMNSATSCLYAALGALGIGYGDEVIVSPYTMSACAVGALIYGAIPIFADVTLETGALDPASIERLVTPRTKAVLVVHQFGLPARMDEIMAVAHKHGLRVIEDCAQAHGATFKGKSVGTFGDIGVFSLNVNKTIQCGEGGVAITDNDELRYRMALIRNHGEAVVGPAGYQDITNIIGFNYRMTELQAAVAIEQLKKLDELNRRRLELVGRLSEGLRQYDRIQVLQAGEREDSRATYYLFTFRYLGNSDVPSREEFVKALNAEGMSFFQGYVRPLYLQPIYQTKKVFKNGYPFAAPENRDAATNYQMGACPNAELLHFKQLVLNEHIRPPHTAEDVDDILRAFQKVLA